MRIQHMLRELPEDSDSKPSNPMSVGLKTGKTGDLMIKHIMSYWVGHSLGVSCIPHFWICPKNIVLRLTCPYGYESIPINTIFRGMNIHLPAIFMFTRGTRFWPTAIYLYHLIPLKNPMNICMTRLLLLLENPRPFVCWIHKFIPDQPMYG